jgi:DNA-binding CsgD family transcriptional regulator
MLNLADYPSGLASVDEARVRAESTEQWYEECRALINNAWACAEWRDIQPALDYAKQAIALAERHELRAGEVYAKALFSRILELSGDWSEATDLARGLLDAAVTAQMVALPVIGAIEARRGRASAREAVKRAWELASATDEFQRLAPAAIACAEYGWISGNPIITVADLERVMAAGLDLGFRWSTGRIACWLWEVGELAKTPAGIAEPYQALIEGDAGTASKVFESRGIPYERALALMHGSQADQLEALELLEALGARAVAAKFRKELRGRGVSVTRGRGYATRRNAAGLTARQAEVLQLLAEDLSNIEIADRLFVSPSTVENHVSAVLDKLDVSTREEAVSRARADGLLGASS